GRYEIIRELGSGAFGTVYLGRDPLLNRFVAIKVPKESRRQTPAFMERFWREGRNAARLDEHRGIVRVYDVGEDEEKGIPYLVFEYVEGEPLHERLAPRRWSQKRPTFREIAEIVAEIAQALASAHSNGVTHRDVKPAN